MTDGRLNVVSGTICVPELLAGLAEECSELAQAALKLRRVYDGQNPTPVTENEAIGKLYEEVADVQLYITLLKMAQERIDAICNMKLDRWIERLMEIRKEV